jgi:eukaryotic-like serine/threonine-protein kinase
VTARVCVAPVCVGVGACVQVLDIQPPPQANFDDVYIISELMDTDLHRVIYSRQKLTDDHVQFFLYQMLCALKYMHSAKVIHRDLKPSNILLGSDGRPRVMDFGIAATMKTASGRKLGFAEGQVVGTPGYISPEAARGEPPVPAMDVFAAGAMLGELLAGAPLLRERDPWRFVERVQKEDLVLPADVRVDDTLRGIVQRALARDVRQRYDGARALHDALAAWLTPPEAPPPEASHGTLEFLLRRMRHKTDFPAMSESVLRIQRVAGSETANLTSLSDEILKDVALTNKLLRMVNSVHFTAVAGGGITTVSRAVSLVGFAGIRNMALSVVLLEHMNDKAHAAQLREEFVRALMAGALGAELSPYQRESEEVFLGAMFQNLGRLLTEYYFPEEALQIRNQLATDVITPEARNAAALRVLGIGLDDLGVGVAKAWGLPDNLQSAMRLPEGEMPKKALPRGPERMRWLGRAANGITDALLAGAEGQGGEALLQAAENYAVVLDMTPQAIASAAQSARGRLSVLTNAMGLRMPSGASTRRLLPTVDPAASAAAAAQAGAAALPGPAAPGAPAAALAANTPAQRERALTQALDGASRALAGTAAGQPLRLNELLQHVMAAMQEALALRSVVFCLRDAKSGELVGRFALGQAKASAFRIGTSAGGDLFSALCAKGADLLIADARTVQARLPAWYRNEVAAGSFLLLPLMLKGAPIGLIYADKAAANTLALTDRELLQLRTLRDKLVAAFTRQG